MIKRDQHPVDELELMAYLDGELSRERAAATAAHLETCSECKALANELGGISRELATWQIQPPELQITPLLSAEIEKHVRSQESSSRNNRRGPRLNWSLRRVLLGSLASVVVLSLLFTISLPNLMRSRIATKHLEIAQPRKEIQGFYQNKERPTPHSNQPMATASVTSDTNGLFRSPAQRPSDELAYASVAFGPMVVRTAEITLSTTDFDQSRARVEEILKRHKGYIGELNVAEATNSARTLTATLRVPSDQLDATIAELKNLGRVEEESQNGEEVSQQYVDLQARLLNARNSEQRLTELLRRAGKLSDVLAVENQIENVRENIERMEAERKNLAKQVDFSTVNVKVSEDYKERVHVVPESTSTRFRNAAVEGYEAMVAGLINVLLFLISWGPSLVLWGAILFFPARWLWRRRQRGILI